ncbi:MAG: hypothetical protein H0W08_11135 [Acidobacteria bacterium]|nr:hypothetical protein [Acidobacteriota bacterium]
MPNGISSATGAAVVVTDHLPAGTVFRSVSQV